MLSPLFDTKLHPPVLRRNLTQRPHLHRRLDDGLADNHRLLLVCAPAGYGKTTLVAEWSTTCTRPVAWLSLDEADGDPAQFVTAVAAALQQVYVDFGAAMMHRLQAAGGTPSNNEPDVLIGLAAALAADLSQREATVLVLDDFHLAATPAVCAVVQILVERAPSLIIAITARTEPDLSLPRWRVRNQLTEVSALDLRFSAEETTRFLHQTMQLDVSMALGAELAQRTEGWAGALQLAALSLRGLTAAQQQAFVTSFSGDHRHIADYLSIEVLRQLPGNMRHFLLVTSPLARLCAPLCNALLEAAATPTPLDCQWMLETVERRGLFLLALDDRRRWYRYHHLFGELLRSHLQQEYPDLAPTLHRRAAEWYLQTGAADAAMHHALQSGDSAFAADIAQQFGVQMVGGSRLGTFLRWLHALEPAAVASRPYLLVGAAWTHVLTGQIAEALHEAELADLQLSDFVSFYSGVDGRMITTAEVRGHVNAVRGYAARLRGDTDGVIRYARRALEDLPADAYTVSSTIALNLALLEMERGELDAALHSCEEAYHMGMHDAANLFVALSALGLKGDIFLQRGQLQEAAARFQDVLAAGAQEKLPVLGMGYLGLSQIALLRGDPAEAQRLLDKGMQLAQEIASSEAMRQAVLFAAEIALYEGDLVRVRQHLAEIDVHGQPGHAAHTAGDSYAVLSSRLALAEGDLAAASIWLGEAPTPLLASTLPYEQRRLAVQGGLQQARLWLADGRAEGALRLLDDVGRTAQELEDWQAAVTAALLRARGYLALRKADAAHAALAEALASAAAQDAAGLIAMESRDLAALLMLFACEVDAIAPFAKRVSALLSLQGVEPFGARRVLVEPLSERELEVLRLMAAGRTNKAIAETLIVAPSTVKTHVNHILAKLNAANRTEAVAQARALGIMK